MYGILLQHLFLCHGSCVQSITGFLYGRCERLFVTELTHEYFTRHNILKEFFLNGYVLNGSLLQLLLERGDFLNTYISQRNVAT